MKQSFTLGELAGRALRMSTPGVSLGALALAPYLLGAGADTTATIAGVLGWAVPVVVVMTLLVLAINDLSEGKGAAYTRGARSYGMVIAVNLAGTGLAYAAYWVILVGASSILAGPAIGALSRTLASGLSVSTSVAIVLISIAGAMAVTAWADSQAGE